MIEQIVGLMLLVAAGVIVPTGFIRAAMQQSRRRCDSPSDGAQRLRHAHMRLGRLELDA